MRDCFNLINSPPSAGIFLEFFMGHENRSRVTVDQNGDWRMYTKTLPANAEPLGVVMRGVGNAGALVRMENGTYYAQVNDGVVIRLDARKISSALGLKSNGGRKSEMEGGKRVTVYLTEDLIERAREIGNGNLSDGIRVVLLKASSNFGL